MPLTAHALAHELLSMPDKPVRVVIDKIAHPGEADAYMPLSDEDALPAETVRHEGAYVLIRGE